MQDNSPLGYHSVIKPKVYLGYWHLHLQFNDKNILWSTCHAHPGTREKVSTPQRAWPGRFQGNLAGHPHCWLARFPKQDVPSCSHRAHRWLTTCFWQGGSLALGYCSVQSCKIFPWGFLQQALGDPMRSPWILYTSLLYSCLFCC